MFKVGQIVRQNTSPYDLIMIVTRIDTQENKFSARVLVNQANAYMHSVGDLRTGLNAVDFTHYTDAIDLGGQQHKFKVGDFVLNAGSFGHSYTGIVIEPREDRFAVVIITSDSTVIEPGEEYRFERYNDWELCVISIEAEPTPVSVGDRLQNIYASGHNMVIVTNVTAASTGEFSGVVVYSDENPAQVGQMYHDLLVESFEPYAEEK